MSQTTPPPTAVRSVPVIDTMLTAYGMVLSRLDLVFKAAALPFVLSVVITGLSLMTQNNAFLTFILIALGFVPYTLFGVAWHRLTLLGPGVAPPALIPGWTRRHWRFLSYIVAIILIANVVVLISAVFGSLLVGSAGEGQISPSQERTIYGVALTLLIVLLYLALRLSFVFPAVSVDENYGLRLSWTHTRGQGLRLLCTVVLTSLPMLVLAWAVATFLGAQLFPEIEITTGQVVPPAGDSDPPSSGLLLTAQLILYAINYVLMALLVSIVSIAFRTCTGWVPAPTGGPPAASGPCGPGG